MRKIYVKCLHRNITYKEFHLPGDRVVVEDVVCADCGQTMPPLYKHELERHLNAPDDSLATFLSKEDLRIYKHQKKEYKRTMRKYKN